MAGAAVLYIEWQVLMTIMANVAVILKYCYSINIHNLSFGFTTRATKKEILM